MKCVGAPGNNLSQRQMVFTKAETRMGRPSQYCCGREGVGGSQAESSEKTQSLQKRTLYGCARNPQGQNQHTPTQTRGALPQGLSAEWGWVGTKPALTNSVFGELGRTVWERGLPRPARSRIPPSAQKSQTLLFLQLTPTPHLESPCPGVRKSRAAEMEGLWVFRKEPSCRRWDALRAGVTTVPWRETFTFSFRPVAFKPGYVCHRQSLFKGCTSVGSFKRIGFWIYTSLKLIAPRHARGQGAQPVLLTAALWQCICLTFFQNLTWIHRPGFHEAPENQTQGQFKIPACERTRVSAWQFLYACHKVSNSLLSITLMKNLIELSAEKSLKIIFNDRSLHDLGLVTWRASKELNGTVMTNSFPIPLCEQGL